MNRIKYGLVTSLLACSAYLSVSISLAQETHSEEMNTPVDTNNPAKDSTSQENVPDDSNAVVVQPVKDEASGESQPKKDKTIQEIKTSVLQVKVYQLGGDNLPIKDARVIVTLDNAREIEYRTDDTGVALLTGLPYGKVDIDVTSSGRQSGGGTVTLDEPQQTLTFRLKPRSFGNH